MSTRKAVVPPKSPRDKIDREYIEGESPRRIGRESAEASRLRRAAALRRRLRSSRGSRS